MHKVLMLRAARLHMCVALPRKLEQLLHVEMQYMLQLRILHLCFDTLTPQTASTVVI